MKKRVLGRSNIEVSPMGLGCWAIGGPFWQEGKACGWSGVNDKESVLAIEKAVDLGINFFDTADCYGAGHSERILAKALKNKRDEVVIATKFGNVFNEETKIMYGYDQSNASPQYIRKACEASLRRLNTDYIDVYQLHIWEYPIEKIPPVVDTLENLVKEGLIRTYGWSTDRVDAIQEFTKNKNCSIVQNSLNVLEDAKEIIDHCEENNLASINRSCLLMGILSGKFNNETKLSNDDVRASNFEWLNYFNDGTPVPEVLSKLEAVKEILQSDGRSIVQGALAWIWARSNNTIPIPGFKSVAQVKENAEAMHFGMLKKEQLAEIDNLLERER